MRTTVSIVGEGFTHIPNSFLLRDDISPEAKGVLCIIASHTEAWEFRQKDMLRKCKCSKNKYYRILDELKVNKFLSVEETRTDAGRWVSQNWTVDFSPGPQIGDRSPKEDQPVPCLRTPNKTKLTKPIDTPLPPKASEHDKIVGALSTVVDQRDALDFIEHRKRLKKPLTERAAQLIARKLSGHPDPSSVICDSIMNGWQGVFPKDQNHARPSRRSYDPAAEIAEVSDAYAGGFREDPSGYGSSDGFPQQVRMDGPEAGGPEIGSPELDRGPEDLFGRGSDLGLPEVHDGATGREPE